MAAQIGAGGRVLAGPSGETRGKAILALAGMGKDDAETALDRLAAQSLDAADLIDIGDNLGIPVGHRAGRKTCAIHRQLTDLARIFAHIGQHEAAENNAECHRLVSRRKSCASRDC